MNKQTKKREARDQRRGRVRVKIIGTAKRPRLSVFRSNTGMYIQLIDDEANQTIVSAHSNEIKVAKNKKSSKVEVSLALGKHVAKKAQEKNITEVVFDRGGYKYHGRVKSIADGAREGGLKF